MKKVLSIVIILCVCLLLNVCTNKTNNKDNKEFKVELVSNATTGYEWSYTVSDNDIIKEKSSEYVTDEHEEGMTGVGGRQIFIFEGLKEGNVKLTFTYTRPWEKDIEPIEIKEYNLVIDSNLNIEEK